MLPDILIRNEGGTIVLLTPNTSCGELWLDENLDPSGLRFGSSYAVEPRYVGPIIEGACEDGLLVAARASSTAATSFLKSRHATAFVREPFRPQPFSPARCARRRVDRVDL